MTSLTALLRANPYPGRGIVCACTTSGDVLGAYFVTGRSPASRAREIRCVDADTLVVAAVGVSEHDPLRHYIAATRRRDFLVFGNGEQVMTVADRIAGGMPPAIALDNLEYEPDPPILTSRITAVMQRPSGDSLVLGTARHGAGSRTSSDIATVTVRDPAPGDAVVMTTFQSDGESIATGAPYSEATCEAAEASGLLDEIWNALNPDFRVAAVVFSPAVGLDEALIRNGGDDIE